MTSWKKPVVWLTVLIAMVMLALPSPITTVLKEGFDADDDDDGRPFFPDLGRASFPTDPLKARSVVVPNPPPPRVVRPDLSNLTPNDVKPVFPPVPQPLLTRSHLHTTQINDGTGNFLLKFRMQYPDPYPRQRGGSCVGHAVGQLIRYCKWRSKCNSVAQCNALDPVRPCAYFLWWIARCATEKTKCLSNTGSWIDRCLQAMINNGYLLEGDWKVTGTNIADLNSPWRVYPPPSLQLKAKQANRRFSVYQVHENQFLNVLLSGHAIIIGLLLGSEGLSRKKANFGSFGSLWKVNDFSGSVRSSHAMLIVGAMKYKNEIYYALQNSWGNKWPDVGYMSHTDYLRRKRVHEPAGHTLKFYF